MIINFGINLIIFDIRASILNIGPRFRKRPIYCSLITINIAV